MKIATPVPTILLLVAASAVDAFQTTVTSSSSSRVEPLSMIRKSKKTVKKGARPSGGGFGGDSSPSSDSSSSSSTATLSPPAWANRFSFAGDIRPGAQTEQKVVTVSSIVPPDYAMDGSPKNARPMLPWVIEVKTTDEIGKMRESGKLARKVLDVAGRAVKPGVTTAEIDEIVHKTAVEVRINLPLLLLQCGSVV